MSATNSHHLFKTPCRVSQSLRNDRCQNILYKAVFEHFIEANRIAALLLSSKSFQNSSFGVNYIVNFAVDANLIGLLESVLSPSSCFSLQFVPSLHIRQSRFQPETANLSISDFVGELLKTKYFHLSLQSLTLHCVTNEVFLFFFGNPTNFSWPQLQYLTLENCVVNDSVLEMISKTALQLRSVNLSKNFGVTDADLKKIATLDGITSLNLSCCKITDVGLRHISKLSGITFLDLSRCYSITDDGLECISNFSGITSLNLSHCDKITDAGLLHISGLFSISSLDISWCNKITDVGIEHISKLCNITSLDLCSCDKLTDLGLKQLAKLCCINSLNLWGCVAITDAGLEHLSKLSCVTSLNLCFCGNVTVDAFTKLKFAMPNCNIKYDD